MAKPTNKALREQVKELANEDPAFREFLKFWIAIHKDIAKFNVEIGLDAKIVANLGKENEDYAYILKWTAYIEAALSQVITDKIDCDLGKVLEYMPLADKYTSKVNLAHKLGLLTIGDDSKTALRFIEALAQVRNKYAHDIKNASLTFPELYEKALKKSSSFKLKDLLEFGKNDESRVLGKFRLHFHSRASIVMSALLSNQARVRQERYIAHESAALIKKLTQEVKESKFHDIYGGALDAYLPNSENPFERTGK